MQMFLSACRKAYKEWMKPYQANTQLPDKEIVQLNNAQWFMFQLLL